MASSSSSCSSSSSPSPQNQATQITPQELFAFHNIDRQLFSRLVFNLRREPSEAMHAAAFWLWLERFNMAHYVDTILTFPDPLLEAILEETFLCLRAAEAEPGVGNGFQPQNSKHSDLSMILSITGMEGITPRFFHENRILVLLGVSNIIQQVCLRAFQDLIQMLLTNRAGPLYNYYFQPQPSNNPRPTGPSGGTNNSVGVGAGGGGGGGVVDDSGVLAPHPPPSYSFYSKNLGHEMFVYFPTYKPPFGMGPSQGASPSTINGYRDPGASTSNHVPIPNPMPSFLDHNFDVDTSHHPEASQDDLIEMVSRIHLDMDPLQPQESAEERAIPSSERTIFLTFSKGYPISESELREFLSRSFGNIVEALYMQEVGGNEQPLYARLVVPDLSAMVVVLNGQGKAKFSINGKHVWARKYIRKNNPNSPPSSPK